MVIIQNNTFISTKVSSYLLLSRRNNKKFKPQFSKQDFSTDGKPLKQISGKELNIFKLRVPKVLLVQSAVAVLGLGFIDAGYSGDWSRIGVITKENEELIKIAAFFVVPLCVYLIYSLSKPEHGEEKT